MPKAGDKKESKGEGKVVEPKKKKCFLICPIGAPGSKTRERSDDLRDLIVGPALANKYAIVRADEIGLPGMITVQIMREVMEDELVVADLTGSNPNVFYELAIRHAVKKPFVYVIEEGDITQIPFDQKDMRVIEYTFHTRRIKTCIKQVKEAAKLAIAHSKDLKTPVSFAQDIITLESSGKPVEDTLAKILSEVQSLRFGVERPPLYSRMLIEDLPRKQHEKLMSRTIKDLRNSWILQELNTILSNATMISDYFKKAEATNLSEEKERYVVNVKPYLSQISMALSALEEDDAMDPWRLPYSVISRLVSQLGEEIVKEDITLDTKVTKGRTLSTRLKKNCLDFLNMVKGER